MKRCYNSQADTNGRSKHYTYSTKSCENSSKLDINRDNSGEECGMILMILEITYDVFQEDSQDITFFKQSQGINTDT